jgi:hypothetical protein
VPQADPRLQPTPDYGTLGPDSDVASSYTASAPTINPTRRSPAGLIDSNKRSALSLHLPHLIAVLIGFGLAFLVSSNRGALWGKIAGPFSSRRISSISSVAVSDRELDRRKPQEQAEVLLESAVSHPNGAFPQAEGQIQARLESWRGKLKWDEQLGNLTTAALNSEDRNVRASAIEVQLAAYGLEKNESSAEALMRQADSSDHAQKIWALWALGLLGNRGIETDRIVQVLIDHLKNSSHDFAGDRGNGSGNQAGRDRTDRDRTGPDRTGQDQDEDSRRWAVEGLALVGTTSTIVPLLDAMHNDPSPTVRERAACSLAASGMLSPEQRFIAVPQLITDSDDPALDAQTHAWAFQALADITNQHLPNDSSAWRMWYRESVASGQ